MSNKNRGYTIQEKDTTQEKEMGRLNKEKTVGNLMTEPNLETRIYTNNYLDIKETMTKTTEEAIETLLKMNFKSTSRIILMS